MATLPSSEQKLVDRDYTPSAETPEAVFGTDYKKKKYEKVTDYKVGKIPRALPGVVGYGLLGVAGSVLSIGIAPALSLAGKSKFLKNTFGKAAKTVEKVKKMKNEPLIGGRTALTTLGILGGPLNFIQSWKDNTTNLGMDGKVEKTVFVKSDEEEDIHHLKYDPKDRPSSSKMSIANYAKKLASEGSPDVRQINGHLVIRERSRKGGITSCIFVPNGDFDKATSIRQNKPDGTPLTNSDEHWRAINDLCGLYDKVESELDKESERIAISMVKEKRSEDDEHTEELTPEEKAEVKELQKAVRSQFKFFVISPDNQHIRVYGDIDRNETKTNSFRTGFVITLTPGEIKAM